MMTQYLITQGLHLLGGLPYKDISLALPSLVTQAIQSVEENIEDSREMKIWEQIMYL